MRSIFLRATIAAALALAPVTALAQDKPAPAKPAAAAPQAQQQMTINTLQLAMMIKSTIMAVQHANQTGNYSVLRDLGTPVFREHFDQAKLTAIFANLRSRGINLSPVMMLAPNLIKQPEMEAGNLLHIVGNFPTQPLQIQYDILFMQIDGVWRIEGLAVDAVQQQAMADTSGTAPAPAPQPQKAAGHAKSGKKPAKASE